MDEEFQIDLASDEHFMGLALREAQKAYRADEVPVGAVVVCNNRIIARAHNLTERLHDVTALTEKTGSLVLRTVYSRVTKDTVQKVHQHCTNPRISTRTQILPVQLYVESLRWLCTALTLGSPGQRL